MASTDLFWFQQPVSNWRTQKKNSEALPPIGAAASRKKAVIRRTIVADKMLQLPSEISKKVYKTGIHPDKLDEHFSVVCNVLHFKMKHIFKTSANASALKEVKEERQEKRKALLAAVKEVQDKSVVHPMVLEWMEELQALRKEKEEEAAREAAEAGDEAPTSSRHEEIIKEGSSIPKVVEAAAVRKLFKGWEEAGAGGYGQVFQTRIVKEKESTAIKLMPHKSSKEQRSNNAEVWFLEKCQHPNIVEFKRAYLVHEEIWVVMEFLEGGTLTDAVKSHSFENNEVAFCARELLKGVSYLHSIQLAHRDIKSLNVMLSTKGEVKLVDFGLCRDMSDGPQKHMVGSPFWMPPEMIRGEPHSFPVDIWSSGICLIELVDGKAPNRGSSLKAMILVGIGEAPLIQSEKASSLLKDFVAKMLTIEQTQRPSAEEMLKHAFLESACERQDMKSVLQQIFLSSSLAIQGF